MLRKWSDHDAINTEAGAVLDSADCDTADASGALASINERWENLQGGVADTTKSLKDAQEQLRELGDVIGDLQGALDKYEDKMEALQANSGDRSNLDKLRVRATLSLFLYLWYNDCGFTFQ